MKQAPGFPDFSRYNSSSASIGLPGKFGAVQHDQIAWPVPVRTNPIEATSGRRKLFWERGCPAGLRSKKR